MGIQPPIEMANLGMWDTLLLMVLALVVFGPRRLPQIGRQIGKLMYEFRKASNDFKFQMEEELRQSEEADRRRKEEAERQRSLAAPASPPPQVDQTVSPPAASVVPTPEEPSETSPASDVSATQPVENRDANEKIAAPESPSAQPSAGGETTRRIQPPSTGEIVAAERPGPPPAPLEPAIEDSGKAPESLISEPERSEPAARHG